MGHRPLHRAKTVIADDSGRLEILKLGRIRPGLGRQPNQELRAVQTPIVVRGDVGDEVSRMTASDGTVGNVELGHIGSVMRARWSGESGGNQRLEAVAVAAGLQSGKPGEPLVDRRKRMPRNVARRSVRSQVFNGRGAPGADGDSAVRSIRSGKPEYPANRRANSYLLTASRAPA